MTEEVKRCPFCGSEARVERINLGKQGLFRVICPECLTATTHLREDEKNAVSDWNSRSIEDALQKELDEAREDNADNMEYHVAERERLKSENARLRKALFFYAELDGNGIQIYGDMNDKALEFVDGRTQPFGTIARTALLNFITPDGSRVELSKLKKAMERIGDGDGKFSFPPMFPKK